MRKILVAVTGASGSIYAEKLLLELEKRVSSDFVVDVILSDTAKQVWEYELESESYKSLSMNLFSESNFFAPPASGSAGYDSMIVCPCSMGTVGRIAAGTSDNLIIRSADVILKERRKLVLVTREVPYSLIHLRNMTTITEAGGVIFPASPSFYNKPTDLNQLIHNFVCRMLDTLNIDSDLYRWGE